MFFHACVSIQLHVLDWTFSVANVGWYVIAIANKLPFLLHYNPHFFFISTYVVILHDNHMRSYVTLLFLQKVHKIRFATVLTTWYVVVVKWFFFL